MVPVPFSYHDKQKTIFCRANSAEPSGTLIDPTHTTSHTSIAYERKLEQLIAFLLNFDVKVFSEKWQKFSNVHNFAANWANHMRSTVIALGYLIVFLPWYQYQCAPFLKNVDFSWSGQLTYWPVCGVIQSCSWSSTKWYPMVPVPFLYHGGKKNFFPQKLRWQK